MADVGVDSLILDLLEWVCADTRTYADALDTWRTSCPRLPVWEEAHDRGFLVRRVIPGAGPCETLTASGRTFLAAHRPRTEASH